MFAGHKSRLLRISVIAGVVAFCWGSSGGVTPAFAQATITVQPEVIAMPMIPNKMFDGQKITSDLANGLADLEGAPLISFGSCDVDHVDYTVLECIRLDVGHEWLFKDHSTGDYSMTFSSYFLSTTSCRGGAENTGRSAGRLTVLDLLSTQPAANPVSRFTMAPYYPKASCFAGYVIHARVDHKFSITPRAHDTSIVTEQWIFEYSLTPSTFGTRTVFDTSVDLVAYTHAWSANKSSAIGNGWSVYDDTGNLIGGEQNGPAIPSGSAVDCKQEADDCVTISRMAKRPSSHLRLVVVGFLVQLPCCFSQHQPAPV